MNRGLQVASDWRWLSAALAIAVSVGLFAPLAGGQTATTGRAESTERSASLGPSASPVPVTSPDAALWESIERLSNDDPVAGGSGGFATRIERRRQLLEKLRIYRASYPGAAKIDEACRRELATLFELGTLEGGDFGELERVVATWLERPPSPASLHEAAYWRIELRSTRGEFGNVRVRLGDGDWEPARLDAYREYAAAYPLSRHVPRIATILYDDAARRGRQGEMRDIATRLARDWPDSGVAEQLSADVRRREAVGKPFSLRSATTNSEIDTTAWPGQTVVIVVWSSIDAASRERVAEVESTRAARQNVRVIGVNLDQSNDAMLAVARSLNIEWPQVHDGRGWAGDFVRTWGVRETPFVLVIDPRGNLVGSTGGDEWRGWIVDMGR
ncbi:MAG: TlpA family protein disulfide reductase [Phycisphaerae bacterium]